MAKVKAKSEGYYEHRMVRPGETFEMKEVDKEGFYVDSKGKRSLFAENGKLSTDGKGQPRKCKWVDSASSAAGKPVDPKEVAAVLSGKQPGAKPAAPAPEADQE